MSYLEELADKRQKQTESALHQESLDAVSNSGKEVVSATNKLAKSQDIDNKQQKSLIELLAAIKQLDSDHKSSSKENLQVQRDLLKALNNLELNPVIKVPETKIPRLDLSPIERVLKQYIPKAPEEVAEKIDLENYKAQDLSETDDKKYQYVGFVNPDGGWYIIENDVDGNKLRYVFGNSGYARAFKKAATYKYRLLNEAVDAL